mmetsp:Transcript_77067/g.226030  ORF Transcript_77067/g.226030 Transcript_77067/m.226030 type:complete len:324 (-) Transcript_77067:297-1268(-)
MVTHSRPRLRHVRQHSAWNLVAIGVAAAALALTVASSCSAFTPSFSPTATPKAQGSLQGSQRPVATSVDAHEEAGRIAGGATWHCFGCAALLLAAATRTLGKGKARKPGHAVIACRAAPAFMPEPPRQEVVPATHKQTYDVCEGHLIDTEAPMVPPIRAPAVPIVPPTLAPSAGARSAFLADSLAEVPQQATPASSRASAAHFVGGARHSRTRRGSGRRAGGSERTARRSLGARLQSSRPVAEVPPMPFDASRLETKIQMGLRTCTCIRSARGREVKTPSSSKASSESAGVCLNGNHFEEHFKRRATSTPLVNTAIRTDGSDP